MRIACDSPRRPLASQAPGRIFREVYVESSRPRQLDAFAAHEYKRPEPFVTAHVGLPLFFLQFLHDFHFQVPFSQNLFESDIFLLQLAQLPNICHLPLTKLALTSIDGLGRDPMLPRCFANRAGYRIAVACAQFILP